MNKDEWIQNQIDKIEPKEWKRRIIEHVKSIGLDALLQNDGVMDAIQDEYSHVVVREESKRLEKEWNGTLAHYQMLTESLLNAVTTGNREEFQDWIEVAKDLVKKQQTELKKSMFQEARNKLERIKQEHQATIDYMAGDYMAGTITINGGYKNGI